MKLQLNSLKSLGLLLPSIIASAIAISPSQAATFASSKSAVELFNFSQEPEFVSAESKLEVVAISEPRVGSLRVKSATDVDSSVESRIATNFASHQAKGKGFNYFAQSQSVITVILGDFVVENEFFFDFSTLLKLKTSLDEFETEFATSQGEISILLYDSQTDQLLDFLTILGGIFSDETSDILEFEKTRHFKLDFVKNKEDFKGKRESVTAKVTGQYSRFFAQKTYLQLVGVQQNEIVLDSVEVPESSQTIALLLFGAMGFGLTLKGYRCKLSHLSLPQLNKSS